MHTITQTVSCQPPAPSPHGLGQDAFTTPLKAIAICALKHADVRIPSQPYKSTQATDLQTGCEI